MNQPTQPPPDKVTASELREWMQRTETNLKNLLEAQLARLAAIDEAIEKLSAQRAQPQAGPAPSGETETIVATAIVKSYDPKGQVMLHIQGGRYSRHGVRVWPEYLLALGINPEALQPGPNPWSKRVLVQPAENGHAPKAVGLAQA